MSKKPTILITNDDGIYSPGIKHLWNALSELAHLVVVAPSREQSAVGLSITIREPLRIERISWSSNPSAELWSVSGTPADCVKLALSVILPNPPDLIVSGINRGSNAGRNVLYSGTIAGVIEGVLHDIPGAAFSVVDYATPDYSKVEPHIAPIVRYLLNHPLPQGTFLNVNFPESIKEGLKGIRFTKQGREFWAENPEQRKHPAQDHFYYWLGAKIVKFEEEDDSDIALLCDGYATCVPIHIGNLTHHSIFERQREFFENFVNA